jgi:uncharacterized phage protein (TIGR01671 family)
MEREIKFRAWDGFRMVHFSDFTIGIEKATRKKPVKPYVCFKNDTFGGQVALGNHKIMQYTGLKDSAGAEIYEGDILKSFHFKEGKKTHYLHHKVVYTEKYITFAAISLGNSDESLTTNGNCILWVYKPEKAEIIGNIYKNKDLLTLTPDQVVKVGNSTPLNV